MDMKPEAGTKARRRGFGSELIEGRIPYELHGHARIDIDPGGARCHIEFPLKHGASILETGAPRRATVFGGALDMTGGPDLGGRHVLVVEDDYYLATDAARALQGAGAVVIGPYPTDEAALTTLDASRPDAAIVDINLGSGPSFKLAEVLRDRGIPFLFVTGYDQGAIPARFKDVERLEKPIQLRRVVEVVAKLSERAT
jgi:CheY-like chemotaxis protein